MAATKTRRGPKPNKIMRDALLVSLHRQAKKGVRTKQLQFLADRLVTMAMRGDFVAIREIFDRVDGRARSVPGHQFEDTPTEIVIRWLTGDEALRRTSDEPEA